MTIQNETIPYDAGSAFPNDSSNGMTLRDWFAGMAMQGITAANSTMDNPYSCEEIVKAAYIFADEMIIERQKCQKP